MRRTLQGVYVVELNPVRVLLTMAAEPGFVNGKEALGALFEGLVAGGLVVRDRVHVVPQLR